MSNMSNTGTLNLTPGPWLSVSPATRAMYIKAAVEVVTDYARSRGDDWWWYDYERGFSAVFGNGQDGAWPHSEEGREVVAAVVDRVGRYFEVAVDLTDDGKWDCARAALVVASGVIV